MAMALYVVKICAGPMILFTGLGMAAASTALRILTKEWRNPFRSVRKDETPVSRRFQFWLFIVTAVLLLSNLVFTYALQTQSAIQNARDTLTNAITDIRESYRANPEHMKEDHLIIHVGRGGSYDLIEDRKTILTGAHSKSFMAADERRELLQAPEDSFFTANLFGTESYSRLESLDERVDVLAQLPTSEIYAERDAQIYEIAFADILLFAVVYTLISQLVQLIVVKNLGMVNASLTKITGGDLNEVVDVRSSSEFASLSDDINQTVDTLKGYITAAEKRIEQELEFARTIQDSALPKYFTFPRNDFEVYASMDPAREVGGDFYDFFFVDQNRIALVIADVSGKGIPAALFMMTSRTMLRDAVLTGLDPAAVLERVNSRLCENNPDMMFVTVWLGVLELSSGKLIWADAGHERLCLYQNGRWDCLPKKGGVVLAAFEPELLALEKEPPFQNHELLLRPGDVLFQYTDGVTEAMTAEREQFGQERMLEALGSSPGTEPETLLPHMRGCIDRFVCGAPQFDDITMLSLQYRGKT